MRPRLPLTKLSKRPRTLSAEEARKQALRTVPEAEWQKHVLEMARLHGWFSYHTYESRMTTSSGFPDLVLVRDTRLIFAELKTETGKVTSEQAAWLERLRRAGQRAEVWRPHDADYVAALLQRPQEE